MKKICVDIDGTICTLTENSGYEQAQPIFERIDIINRLHNSGAEIVYWTARGGSSGKDYRDLTEAQLKEWGCKYTELRMDKMSFDYLIDDKAFNSEKFFSGGYFS